MDLFRSQPVYHRTRVIDTATPAGVEKKRGRAIERYRWIPAVEPRDGEVRARRAPLLAQAVFHGPPEAAPEPATPAGVVPLRKPAAGPR